jgi:hypothetical protein
LGYLGESGVGSTLRVRQDPGVSLAVLEQIL